LDPHADGVGQEGPEETPSATPEGDAWDADRSITVSVNGRPWHVNLGLVTDEARTTWLDVRRANELGGSRVELTLNRAHPFMRNFAEIPTQDLEPVWRLAIAIGLAQELARDSGDKAGYVLLKVNMLLKDYLSKQAREVEL